MQNTLKVFILFLNVFLIREGVNGQAPFSIKAGLYDQTKVNDLGLAQAAGTETVTVFKPGTSTNHFSNGVVLTAFKGYLYCQWQSSPTNEDSPDTWVAYSRSVDGKTWTTPMKIAGATSSSYCTSGGWWVYGDTLIAYVNVWPSSLSPKGGFTYYAKSTDGLTWSTLKQVMMADGTVMKGIFEQDPHTLPNGRIISAVHFQPGLIVAPVYTDDPSGIRGWKRATYTNMAYSGDATRELEPSWFRQSNGSAVMIFRDQNSTYYKLAAKSTNNGVTWSTAVITNMPDSRAKQSAGNLPDGTAYMVSNPVNNKTRYPLVITLSKDGQIFDRAFVMRKGGSDLQAQKYTGTAKTLGYSYPKSMVWNGYLYAAYSTNKEDVEYTRIPLSSLNMGSSTTIQAETACTVTGILNETKNAGFNGTGYVNVDNAVGSSASWVVNSASSQTVSVGIRYASVSNVNRNMSLKVNGVVQVATVTFPSTGAWTTWNTATVQINLTSGRNTLQLSSLISEGGPNIDELTFNSLSVTAASCTLSNQVPVVGITVPSNNATFTAPASITIHANATDADGTVNNVQFFNGTTLLGSDASLPYSVSWTNVPAGTYVITAKVTDNAGAITTSAAITVVVNALPANNAIQAETACSVTGILSETKNTGFNGMGYVNVDNAVGTSASWSLSSSVNQTVTLSIRYANASVNSRNMSALVNGVTQVASINFVSTGAWTTWNVVNVQLNLVQGTNTLQLVSLMGEGAPNIDEFIFSSSGSVTLGTCGSGLKTTATFEEINTIESSTIRPNPSTDVFNLTVKENVESFTIISNQGAIVYEGGFIEKGETFSIGDQLENGLYILFLRYTDGRTENKKIQKMQ